MTSTPANAPPPAHVDGGTPWLIRIPEVFADYADEAIQMLGLTSSKKIGTEYHLVGNATGRELRRQDAAVLIQWSLPVHHSWPCNPQKMDGFIEKAAQTLLRKFGQTPLQGIFVGQLHPTSPNPYYRSLASNLRGRVLQLFPSLLAASAEEQDSRKDSLFCLVGKEGLYCGVQSPLAGNGFYPGGTKYIKQEGPDTISRAGAKIAEALHYLALYQRPPGIGAHWIELGASPGGMTSELLNRGYRVTAVDRAPLDVRLHDKRGLEVIRADAAEYRPKTGARYDALLSDLNGAPDQSITHVARLAPHLKPGGLVVFTLKVTAAQSMRDILRISDHITDIAAEADLDLLAKTHLTYNRRELTLFFLRG